MALIKMLMPKMGESIMEGTILRWLKKVGEKIDQDESVLEVATDKVDTEVPALDGGYLMEILAKEGEVVAIGSAIAIINTEPISKNNTENPSSNNQTAHQIEESYKPINNYSSNTSSEKNNSKSNPYKLSEAANGRFYSPLVLTIAREEGITMHDLEYIVGTGGEDRVTKKDILNYLSFKNENYNNSIEEIPSILDEEHHEDKIISIPLEKKGSAFISLDKPYFTNEEEIEEENKLEENKIEAENHSEEGKEKKPEPVEEIKEASFESKEEIKDKQEEKAPEIKYYNPEPQEPVNSPAVSVNGNMEIIEMDRMRKMIAQRMVDSKRISPHVTSFVEADVTNIVFWRNRVKHEFKEKQGDAITFTPIFIEAVARALRDYPMLNISVDGDKILIKKDINIGMAVALPNGNLIVPVIHNADQLNIVGLTKRVNDLARRARENKLKLEDLEGGTYTISNIGSFGNVMGTPIINQPQVGIMSLGAIQKKPAVIETPFGDTLGIRQMMYLSHSYDHRVVDGALGGMFVRRVADYLENFDINRKIS